MNPLSYDFMQYAVLAGTFTALAAGVVGYFVVLRNEVFTSDALGHVAFTGGLGALLGGLQLLAGVFASTIAVAVGMGTLGGRSRGRDVAIGTVFAWVLGLGVLFLSLYTSNRSASGGTGTSRSPYRWSGTRLVTSTLTPGAARSTASTTGAAPATCS